MLKCNLGEWKLKTDAVNKLRDIDKNTGHLDIFIAKQLKNIDVRMYVTAYTYTNISKATALIDIPI